MSEKEGLDMIQKQYNLWAGEEYEYPVYGAFMPSVTSYLHDEDEKERPAIVIVPGGGYCAVSPSEGEIVAKKFYEKGYHTFVVTYTTNLLMDKPLKFQALKDLSRAIVWIRKHAEELHVCQNAISICGFSAGGHLCGSLGVHYESEVLKEKGKYAGISNRPDAMILSYPVITSGAYAHKDSFDALLGIDASSKELEYMSLEKHVSRKTPPVFIWTMITDELVPAENSFLFAQACKQQCVPVELHIFGNGKHGMSLADKTWKYKSLTGLYCMQQFFEIMQYLVDHDLPLPSPYDQVLPPPYDQMGRIPRGTDMKQLFVNEVKKLACLNEPDKGIAKWPELADIWLKKILF